MQYTSTRNHQMNISSSSAILQGISPDGGLFVPATLPTLTPERIAALADKDYIGRAQDILKEFLTDFSPEEIARCCAEAYGQGCFDNEKVAPLSCLTPNRYLLELWHGPTCAFKDMALQMLPRLMTTAAKIAGETREILVLVATSGDTGKAAMEGFADVPGTKLLVYYPQDGVSHMQKLQMTTQDGENLAACGIKGNFDDAQNGVKALFADKNIAKELDAQHVMLSSANSINWGRLVPQIVYYISAYCDLLAAGEITTGEMVNVVVPTGNFGNILAAYYAKTMGLPLGKLICASNQNNVLTDFMATGCYNRNRPFYATLSPSMDILISSNLERLLFHLLGDDDKAVGMLMTELAQKGSYQLPSAAFSVLQTGFWAGCCDDAKTQTTIQEVFRQYSYLLDTHTAVAVAVYEDYVKMTGDSTKTIIASTANPYKFPASVLSAIEGTVPADEFAAAAWLEALTGCPIPDALAGLQQRVVRFPAVCTPGDMWGEAEKLLAKQK